MRIGEVLVAKGVLTHDQLDRALLEQRDSGRLLGDVLLSLDFVTEETLGRTLADAAGVPFLETDPAVPDSASAALVPEDFARRYEMSPLGLTGDALQVIQANPFDVLALDELRQMTGRAVYAACGTPSCIRRLLDFTYGVHDEMSELVRACLAQPARLDSQASSDEAPLIKLVDLMIDEAARRNATDLHVEPEDRVVRLRYRVDGVLMPGDTLPKELHAAIVSRLKAIAGLDIAEQRLPQDGRIAHTADGRVIDLRVSTFPTTLGEKVALRLLEKEKLVRRLEDLGFNGKSLRLFRDILGRSRGIVLVTGPAGAGKTTTVYSALSSLGRRDKNIITVEDPVEHELPIARQTQVRSNAGFTSATAIRALLRQDPDVIMIGEIRDPETAHLAVQVALSGVLVFSTLPTQDSAGAMPRLMDMGVEPYLLASVVAGVIAQRLLRIICPECREEATYSNDMLAKVGLASSQSVKLYRGRGCTRCLGTGYRGRTGAFEILRVDPRIEDLIRQRADSRLIKEAAVHGGMKTLLDDALSKALFGVTTLEEVLRVAF